MQKVVGSSPIIRFGEGPGNGAFSVARIRVGEARGQPAGQPWLLVVASRPYPWDMRTSLIGWEQREQRSVARDLDVVRVWRREVAEDLLRDSADPELLAEEELVTFLLDRIFHARMAA